MSEWEDAVQVRIPDRVGSTKSNVEFFTTFEEMHSRGQVYDFSFEAMPDGTDQTGYFSYWTAPDELTALIYTPVD